MKKVIAEDGSDRQHASALEGLLNTTQGTVRVASPYITENPLAMALVGRRVEILTSLSPMDIVSGAMSLHALKALIDMGAECREMTSGPKFHAKVYIFGDVSAVVTSANFTGNGLKRNIEVGVQLTGRDVDDLAAWFDTFWAQARPISDARIMNLIAETSELRREFRSMKSRAGALRPFENEDNSDLPNTASHFFLCNTNRKNGPDFESVMHDQGYAAVWEKFNYPGHMEKVQSGLSLPRGRECQLP
jgi:hypothetical protein